jgi:hypothetical protein
MFLVGGTLFVGSISSARLWTELFGVRTSPGAEGKEKKIIDIVSLSDVKSSTGTVLETDNGGSMKRNDSEFSLGLTRSNSFDATVSTLGPLCIFPLCDAGEAVWGAGEYAAKFIFVLLIAKTVFEASGGSLQTYLKKK